MMTLKPSAVELYPNILRSLRAFSPGIVFWSCQCGSPSLVSEATSLRRSSATADDLRAVQAQAAESFGYTGQFSCSFGTEI